MPTPQARGRRYDLGSLFKYNMHMIPFQLGKFLVIFGVLLVAVGLLLMGGAKFSFLGLGRLPGDIVYKGKNVQFYFPIVTCLVLSAVLTLVFWVISHLTRR
jgi:predicted Co/Zn/Cd cation transporter (cation efflux family)